MLIVDKVPLKDNGAQKIIEETAAIDFLQSLIDEFNRCICTSFKVRLELEDC